jgi:two-component sensor histidine kinase
VSLTLHREGESLVLEMRDDGVGLPPQFSLDTSASLGLQIVQTLVTQDLEGRFDMGSANGTWARITVPLAETEEANGQAAGPDRR